jgi:hypothetical protein
VLGRAESAAPDRALPMAWHSLKRHRLERRVLALVHRVVHVNRPGVPPRNAPHRHLYAEQGINKIFPTSYMPSSGSR